VARVEEEIVVGVDIHTAFAVSQTTGDLRASWDPFIREQHLLAGATQPAKGVRTMTTSRHGLRMVSEYTSFRPPHQVGMRMVEGPAIFSRFGGGWVFTEVGDGRTRATWRYTFTVQPSWLAPAGDRIGRLVLGHDIRRRIRAFAGACVDPAVVSQLP
jgi:hypothetical protein